MLLTSLFIPSDVILVVSFLICLLLRCGENERPLNEFLILQLGAEHSNGRYNISICKNFGRQCNQEKKMSMEDVHNKQVYGYSDTILTLPEYEFLL